MRVNFLFRPPDVKRDLAHPLPNFHRGQKVHNLASFSTSLNFERSRLKMQQDIRTLKQTSCVGMIALCSHNVWWSWVHAPLRKVCQSYPNPKIARRKRAKSSTTQWCIIRFCSNLVRSWTHDTLSDVKVLLPGTSWAIVIDALGMALLRYDSVQFACTWLVNFC